MQSHCLCSLPPQIRDGSRLSVHLILDDPAGNSYIQVCAVQAPLTSLTHALLVQAPILWQLWGGLHHLHYLTTPHMPLICPSPLTLSLIPPLTTLNPALMSQLGYRRKSLIHPSHSYSHLVLPHHYLATHPSQLTTHPPIAIPNPVTLPLTSPPQNVYAPEEDPELKVEHYTRSTDQNELLGLDQMNVD